VTPVADGRGDVTFGLSDHKLRGRITNATAVHVNGTGEVIIPIGIFWNEMNGKKVEGKGNTSRGGKRFY
jgi:hypothetical protein